MENKNTRMDQMKTIRCGQCSLLTADVEYTPNKLREIAMEMEKCKILYLKLEANDYFLDCQEYHLQTPEEKEREEKVRLDLESKRDEWEKKEFERLKAKFDVAFRQATCKSSHDFDEMPENGVCEECGWYHPNAPERGNSKPNL